MQENQQEVTEIEIKDLLLAWLGNWKWILLFAAVGALLAFGATWLFMPNQYISSAHLYVNNTSDDGAASSAININDINASQKLVNTYIVILQNDEVMNEVIARLKDEYDPASLQEILPLTPGSLRSVISMTSVDNTEVLRIDAKTQNAELSARICTIMTEVAPDILMRVVKAGSVEVIGEAIPAASPSSPSFPTNSAIGFLLGAVLVLVAVTIRFLTDNRVKDEEGLRQRFEIPVLGQVPNFDKVSKDGYKYGY